MAGVPARLTILHRGYLKRNGSRSSLTRLMNTNRIYVIYVNTEETPVPNRQITRRRKVIYAVIIAGIVVGVILILYGIIINIPTTPAHTG